MNSPPDSANLVIAKWASPPVKSCFPVTTCPHNPSPCSILAALASPSKGQGFVQADSFCHRHRRRDSESRLCRHIRHMALLSVGDRTLFHCREDNQEPHHRDTPPRRSEYPPHFPRKPSMLTCHCHRIAATQSLSRVLRLTQR